MLKGSKAEVAWGILSEVKACYEQATAFCPGHITGFFHLRHENLLETGSRGAGLCVRLGAQSRVVLQRAWARSRSS